jgi:hypothetical protein
MRGFTFLVVAAVAGIGFTATTPKAEAQVSVDIGVAPDVPMVTMTPLLIAVLPLATTVQSGLTGTASLVLAHGFMALATSRAT